VRCCPPRKTADVDLAGGSGLGELPRLLARLTERERTVICSRYGIGHREQTLREVAGRLGVTAERVRQIEHASLTKLCAPAEAT
jgi:DNA-directed RNA polymerase sigma subunit (sigma70/sigma32)